jgi:uncharacterized protein (DUF1697 family)
MTGIDTAPSDLHVALLRGVNVGGKNRVAMKDLATHFENAGCTDVQTYVQSGNVVFRAPRAVATRAVRDVAKRLASPFAIVLRSAAEWMELAQQHPFEGPGVDPKQLHVAFLADRPPDARVRSLDPDRSPPDVFQVRGREIYLHTPKGIARSKLTTDYFDEVLGTTSTMRGWTTVQRLLEMTRA